MREYALLIDKGASFKIRIGTVDAETDAPIDLSTWDCVFKIKDQKNQIVIEKSLSLGAEYFDLFLTAEETDTLTQREYRYSVDISKGTDTPRILKGDVKVYSK